MAELATRGTSNGNVSGNSEDRRRRRAWLVETYRADVDLPDFTPSVFPPPDVPIGPGQAACRCYRCGTLLTVDTVTVDRIIRSTVLQEPYRDDQPPWELTVQHRAECRACQWAQWNTTLIIGAENFASGNIAAFLGWLSGHRNTPEHITATAVWLDNELPDRPPCTCGSDAVGNPEHGPGCAR